MIKIRLRQIIFGWKSQKLLAQKEDTTLSNKNRSQRMGDK